MNKLERLLVLGSEGFIGNNVVKRALLLGWKVWGVDIIDRSPVNYHYHKLSLLGADLENFLALNEFDIIINCAGSGNVGFSYQHSITDFDLNSRSTLFVLEAIRKHQPNVRYVHISSAAVYGNPSLLPISEKDPLNPVSPYGYHKWVSEILCGEYSALYGIQIAVARPFSVYGPGLQKQIVWDLMRKAMLEDSLQLWGTGEETRDFIFVDDLAAALIQMGQQANKNMEVFNLGCGQAVRISDIAQLVLQQMKINKRIFFNGEIRQGDPRFWEANINLIKNIGFTPKVSLSEGLDQTVSWFKTLNVES